jgi:hypothetical protein
VGRPRGRVGADLTEGLALLAIGLAVLFGGGALLVELRRFEAVGVALVALGILGFSLSIRRVFRSQAGGEERLAITVRGAYLTGLILVLLAIVIPSRTTTGAAIAMIEVAIAFDLFSRLVPTRVGP